MKKVYLISMLLCAWMCASSQGVSYFGRFKVVAVKGNVSFNSKQLALNDVFEITKVSDLTQSLRFSSAYDWVKARNTETNEVKSFYVKQPQECIGCMGTRGANEINSDIELINYFSKPILVFDADTLVLNKTSFRTNENIIAMWVFEIPEISDTPFYTYAGKNDTLFISHEMMFREINQDSLLYPSFYLKNIRLAIHNINTKDTIFFTDIQNINIYFFPDIVKYLYRMGLTEDEVFQEIINDYIDVQTILDKNTHLNSGDEARTWLKEKILLYK